MRETARGTQFTARNQYIRMCIAKALIHLLESKNLEEITITALAKAANVSRMTFYKYYSSKQEVLVDYMYELMNEYMESANRRRDIGHFQDQRHICHFFSFFKEHNKEIMTLINADMYSIVINAVNTYMEVYVLPESKYSKYELYYYAGALCNIYIQWLNNGMVETPEEIAMIVYKHTVQGHI